MSFSLSLGTLVGFLILLGKEDLGTTIYAIFFIELYMYAAFFLPFIIYYFRNELEMVLQLNNEEIDKKSTSSGENNSQWLKKLIICHMKLTILSFCNVLPLYLTTPMLTNDEKYFLNIKSYVFPNPFIKKIGSTTEFVICNILSFCTFSLLPGIVSITPYFMINIVAYEFYLLFEHWCSSLAEYSADFKISVEELNEKYSQVKRISATGIFDYKRAVEAERQQFMINIVGLIRDYQIKIR